MASARDSEMARADSDLVEILHDYQPDLMDDVELTITPRRPYSTTCARWLRRVTRRWREPIPTWWRSCTTTKPTSWTTSNLRLRLAGPRACTDLQAAIEDRLQHDLRKMASARDSKMTRADSDDDEHTITPCRLAYAHRPASRH